MKILLVEDNPDHAELVTEACEQAFPGQCMLEHRYQLDKGLTALSEGSFDLMLCDLKLPDSPIASTVDTLKNLETPVPIIILTSLNDTELSRDLVHTGIQDYLPKEELSAALLHRVCIYAVERKKQQLQLEKKAADQQMFCQSLSHDFKSPVRNISQLSILLKDSLEQRIELNGHERQLFELLKNRVKTMEALIDGLYEYLRADWIKNRMEPVDLNVLISEVASFCKAIEEKPIRVEVDTLPTVRGASSQLFILFQNLLVNAMKYNDNEPFVKITCNKDGYYDYICIQDNGVGIPEDQLDRVFKPFQRLHSDDQYTGSGLGLSIVNRIVANHQGTICVESELGKGSRFTVALPLLLDA